MTVYVRRTNYLKNAVKSACIDDIITLVINDYIFQVLSDTNDRCSLVSLTIFECKLSLEFKLSLEIVDWFCNFLFLSKIFDDSNIELT